MNRAPFQVLVLPFRVTSCKMREYVLFRREPSTGGYQQGIAGSGELGEKPIETAKREAFEEAGIPQKSLYTALDSMTMIPVVNICGFLWGLNILVIPEYSFGVEVEGNDIQLSIEHTAYIWANYHEAIRLLRWDSNKSALWELDYRIKWN